MYHDLIFFLFKIKLRQPKPACITHWIKTSDAGKLEYALKHGNYRTRELAATALEFVGCSSSIPVLLNAVNDPIQKVSIAALNTLETLDTREELSSSIIRKRLNWFKHHAEKERRRKKETKKKHSIYRWERTSKKNFELVKERLKRSIR